MNKILCLAIFLVLLSSCRQKFLLITSSKDGISTQTVENYDREIYAALQNCANVKVKIIPKKHLLKRKLKK